jgi:hypothetical protein
MDFFDVVTTQRAIRRLKPDPIPDAVLRQIMDAAICAPSGGNRQGWSFLVVRDAAKRARLGELYREAWGELMKTPYYRGASVAPPDSREGKMLASAQHLSDHLGEAPALILACVDTDGAKPTLTTGASIYPAAQNIMLAARALAPRPASPPSTSTAIRRKEPARHPGERRDRRADPAGVPAWKFGRAPGRSLVEVVYADHWRQAFGI